ncbi:MAG TPA: hypothetical protein VGF17_02775 [Phytomonospora sp.]
MTHPYRGNDDRQMSGEGEVDEEAEHEAEEHAEDVRGEDPDAIADPATEDDDPPVAPA